MIGIREIIDMPHPANRNQRRLADKIFGKPVRREANAAPNVIAYRVAPALQVEKRFSNKRRQDGNRAA
ncbi:MAG: hypothetical protein ACFB20_04245 [Opitutales bacterium]